MLLDKHNCWEFTSFALTLQHERGTPRLRGRLCMIGILGILSILGILGILGIIGKIG